MFRFTIRDLLWLMVVVGIGCAWYLNDHSWKRICYRESLKSSKIINEQGRQLLELMSQNAAQQNASTDAKNRP
jgi:hypothetical protein